MTTSYEYFKRILIDEYDYEKEVEKYNDFIASCKDGDIICRSQPKTLETRLIILEQIRYAEENPIPKGVKHEKVVVDPLVFNG